METMLNKDGLEFVIAEIKKRDVKIDALETKLAEEYSKLEVVEAFLAAQFPGDFPPGD